jgi:hypothetical protein
VNVILVEVSRRGDNKLYPAQPLSREQRNRIRWLIHDLHCRGGLTVRAAQRVMLEQHGVRRSLGALSRDLTAFECKLCADPPGDQQPGPPADGQQPAYGSGWAGAGWAGPAPPA